MLQRLLKEVAAQETGDLFEFSIVVVDNDPEQSARNVAANFAATSPVQVTYETERTSNIALARNKAVASANGEYLAFIDDDEIPVKNWLLTLFLACQKYRSDGVLGPVHPQFEGTPPDWLKKGGFYNRPTHETGFVMSWNEARTGNVLIRKKILEGEQPVFRPEFGIGGEDQDFFRRMMEKGRTFIWCDEAPAFETIPPHRWEFGFLLKRALLRGRISSRHPKNRVQNIIKSVVAVPLYTIALPLLFLLGQHLFMKYFIRLFDHVGRLLALLNLNPIEERCN